MGKEQGRILIYKKLKIDVQSLPDPKEAMKILLTNSETFKLKEESGFFLHLL